MELNKSRSYNATLHGATSQKINFVDILAVNLCINFPLMTLSQSNDAFLKNRDFTDNTSLSMFKVCFSCRNFSAILLLQNLFTVCRHLRNTSKMPAYFHELCS